MLVDYELKSISSVYTRSVHFTCETHGKEMNADTTAEIFTTCAMKFCNKILIVIIMLVIFVCV